MSEKDEMLEAFLQWYLDEQVEEVDSSDTVLKKVLTTEGNQSALTVDDK